MISINNFMDDNRFNCKLEDAKRIFKKKVKKYEICYIKVGSILKNQNHKLIELNSTESYKFLNNEIDEEKYTEYCEQYTFDYEKHNVNSFNKLVIEFCDYSLEKCAIIVDQFNIIRDGQHRASILLKKFDYDYEIPVVKVYYSGLKIKTRLLLLIYKIKKNIWR